MLIQASLLCLIYCIILANLYVEYYGICAVNAFLSLELPNAILV